MNSLTRTDLVVAENLLARLDRVPITRSIIVIGALLTLAWMIESFDIGIVGSVILALKTCRSRKFHPRGFAQ
jgi:GTP-sensing pleiotropic transcriptional regulator CodY